ncbi:MAG: hypothetical protein RIQ81_2057 [Pseudomonadota bacterium]|jgi:tetratricopeptide (TPR) repeat protein
MGYEPVTKTIFDTKDAPVYVVHATSVVRIQIVQVLKGLGFSDVTGAADVAEAVKMLSDAVSINKPPKWILTQLFPTGEANALQLGMLISRTPELSGVNWSLIPAQDELFAVQFGLENGMLSFHPAENLSQNEGIQSDLQRLMDVATTMDFESEIITLNYTYKFLKANRHHPQLLKMSRTMVELKPKNAEVLYCYADGLTLNGKVEEAKKVAKQAVWADQTMLPRVQQLVTEDGKPLLSPEEVKLLDSKKSSVLEAFGVSNCVIVDSDTSSRQHVKNAMTQLGLSQFHEFEDGEAAWNHIKANKTNTLLVTEWKLRKLSGMALVQRMAQAGIQEIPVLVCSAQLGAQDKGLLEELGTAVVIPKPLTLDHLVEGIRSAVREENMPSAYKGAIRKVRGLMRQGQVKQAKKLWTTSLTTMLIPTVYQKATEAEIKLAEAKLEDAYAACHQALTLGARGAYFYNLMGKVLSALGDYDRASKWLEKANAEVPLNVERLAEMAAVEMNRGDLEKASEIMDKASAVDTGNEKVMEAKAMLAIEKGDQDAASDVLKQLNDMMNVVAHLNNRAVTMAWKGDPNKGVELYRQALQAAPTSGTAGQKSFSPSVTYNLAMALARKGDLKGAKAVMDGIDLANLSKGDPRLAEKVKALNLKITDALNGKGTLNLEIPKTNELSRKRILQLNKVAEMAQAKAAMVVKELKLSDTIDYRAVKMAEKPLYFKPKKAAAPEANQPKPAAAAKASPAPTEVASNKTPPKAG